MSNSVGALRWFIDRNIALSSRMDSLFWPSMTTDGNDSFVAMVKSLVGNGLIVADVGGGKSPLFSSQEVTEKGLSVIGIDIDRSELDAAPCGAYHRTILTDITLHRDREEADVVVVQSLLEHVPDNEAGMEGIASFCKPGGRIFTFCPNRRAWFAIINRILPERVQRAILFAIYPETRDKQGLPAFYDRCTPHQLSQSMRSAGLNVDRIDPYFVSSYFMFFFPLYLFWRLINVPLMKLWPMSFCETFVIRASKPESRSLCQCRPVPAQP